MAIRARPPMKLHFAAFPAALYPGLNGSKPLPATRLDIERSLLMVGYPSARGATATVGMWRSRLLSALVRGYLDSTLATSTYFLALEPSERVSMTFLLAQAFTHWAADHYMSIPILEHLHGTSAVWTLASTTRTVAKSGAGTPKAKGRPDFIGIEPGGAYHVFESKGRSLPTGSKSRPATIAAGCMPAALAQVSRIATVQGVPPKTRTAAVWVLRHTDARGYLADPPAAGEAYDLTFDLTEALAKYYCVVIDAGEVASTVRSRRYARLDVADGRQVIVERKLLDMVRGLDNGLVRGEEVLALLEARGAIYRRIRRFAAQTTRMAFGLDGVGLLVSDKDIGD